MRGQQWSSRSLGSKFKHQIFYSLIRWLGAWAAYPLLYVVVFYYSLLPSVRRRSQPYLSRRFPGSGRFSRWRQAFRLNLCFGLVLLERAIMGITGRMDFSVDDQSEERIRQLLAEGRGLVVLSAHVGAWQTGLGRLDTFGTPINIVQRRQSADVDRHYFEHRKGVKAPNIIEAAEPVVSLAAMTSALVRREVLCMMGDRVWPGENLTFKVSFMGGPILISAMPFYLANKVGTPIVVVFTRRTGRSQGVGEIWTIIRPRSDSRNTDDLAPYAKIFADHLERYVAAEPFEFFNFYDLWNIGDGHVD
ncbi:MAG: lysophospholipid acyltransferase family protein [Deltaproteobacteria bacterium]|jgi:predicted LPLAT superfamily acyltransferase|nr:lysophospholipid acyltransferase family protein [Deltaproteobacteria bacterium]